MSEHIPSHFVDLVHDALLKSFWRKTALLTFLRRHNISATLLVSWHESETKRAFLARLFPQIESHSTGPQVLKQMAVSLADQTTFPDLEGWEDAAQKVAAATTAVSSLKKYLAEQSEKAETLRQREAIKKQARERLDETIRTQKTLAKLDDELKGLAAKLGTQEGGYSFQTWFYDLVDFAELACRRPYSATGRQIDGSITVEGTTYLVELKFTKEPSSGTDIDSLLTKVRDKADNTMGIMVSMSGYTSVARTQASGRGSPLLLLDYSHVYLALRGEWSLGEIISRVRRHASQTSEAFLSANEFNG